MLAATATGAAQAAGDADASAAPAAGEAARAWEGAVGLVGTFAPEYAGAGTSRWHLVPAGFVRYGRFTITGAGGFTTRSNDDVERGVSASLLETSSLRAGLTLRYENGRRETASARLLGLGDIDPTIRARLHARWNVDGHWSVTAGVSVDALEQGGGWTADLGIGREWRLARGTRLQWGASLTYAGDTYFQRWYGVTPEQALRTGLPVYAPGEGLRDAGTSITLRHDFGPRWSGFVSGSLSRQLGPAAASPLVTQPTGWSLSSGLAWRF